MKLKHLDHLVLTVSDLDKTVGFYEKILGMKQVHFGNGRIALGFCNQKINLHQEGKEFQPNARNAIPGSADLCFITYTPIKDVINILKGHKIKIIAGPGERSGAIGKLFSVYFRDPDGNLLEVSNYKDEINTSG